MALMRSVSFHMKAHWIISVLALLSTGGCSTTPGDTAARGGHSAQAADLYRRGAEQGDATAAFKLGRLLEEGTLRDPAFGSAGDWYLRACDLGDMVGCHNAGTGLEYGSLGLGKNIEKARSCYARAAERGYMQSQYNLGTLYANQYFDDNVEGLTWLLASQDNARGCAAEPLCKWILEDPPHHIARLRARMSPDEITKAEARAKSLAASK